MLTPEIARAIEGLVYSKPRSVQEIAEHIHKNWRTADRYLNEISKQFGTISTRVFREGTRGALKVAYWASIEKVSHSVFQERLEQDIFKARRKEDFSAFDIFQYADAKQKKVSVEQQEVDNINELKALLLSAQKQLLLFSGNLSFVNLKDKRMDLFDTFDELFARKVSIKALCRVDIAGRENVEKMLSLNFKHGKELVEVRHDEQPLRAVVIDNNIVRLKEVKEPTGRSTELNKRLFIFYTIKDKFWVEWLSRIFWKKFANSVDAKKRIAELERIPLKF
jgi:hypothetical protein